MNMRSEVNSQEAKARNVCRQKKDQEGFRVRFINDYIGSGVFCEKSFWKGDFLLEYRGELISGEEATHRDENYPDSKGSFLYFFQHGGKRKCIDGTASDGRGRMVNDSHKNANCKMKVVLVEGVPRLCLFAIKELKKGDELRCDYGVKDLPWRKLEEETNSLPSHDPPSDSESCDTPCDVGNRHKRRKKSQNSTAMERAVHLPKVEVVIKLEPPEDTQDNFDCNYTIHEGIALPVVQTSSQGGGPSSTFGNMETLSSNVCTDQSGTGSIDAENITFIPETEDLQAFIQSHTDSSQEDEALKLCSISVPFIQLGDNLNSNLTESGQSYEEVNGDVEARTVSSDRKEDGNDDETDCTSGFIPSQDPESWSDILLVSKTEPEGDVSQNSGPSSDGGDQNGVDDPATVVNSDEVSAGVDTSSSEVPGRPRGLKKPSRKCPFCLKFQENLARHIKNRHKDLRRVQDAMMLPEKQQRIAFGLMRKEGILITNMQRMKGTRNPVFQRERRSQARDYPLVICSQCKGFYSDRFFSKHKCEAAKEGQNHPIPISVVGSEEVNGDIEARTVSSDREGEGHDYETDCATGLPSQDPEFSSDIVLVPKTESEGNVSQNSGSFSDGGGQDAVGDPSTVVSSGAVPAGLDPSNNAVPGRPRGVKKPRRKCPFCLKFQEKLPRHIKNRHKDLRRVKEAMMLPEKQQRIAFGLMRKEGILITNMQRMKETRNPVFQRERRSQAQDHPLVICSQCKGFYSDKFFSKHKCEAAKEGENQPIPVSVIGSENPENGAGSHTHSDGGSCGMCCEEELPVGPSSDHVCYTGEHTLVGSDDLLLHSNDGHVYDSSVDLCSEGGYTSGSDEDLYSDGVNTSEDERDDLKMCSEEGHTLASINNLHSEEAHCSNDSSQSKEGHPGGNDSHCVEGYTLVGSDDLPSKEGYCHAVSNDLHSEEGHSQKESYDFTSKEGHSHVGSSDSQCKEGHTRGGCDKSQLPKEPPNLSEKNKQRVYVEPEAHSVKALSEEYDLSKSERVTETVAISPLTQDSYQSGDTSLENTNKKITKSLKLHSKSKISPKKCPFCLEFIKGSLRGHIESAHVDLKQVKDVMDLPEKEQKVAFSLMRKAGTLLAKKGKMDQPEPVLERGHRTRTGGSMVICGGCEEMYPYRSFWRHKVQCLRESLVPASSGSVSTVTSVLESNLGPLEFKQEILDHLPTDKIGEICGSDPTLLLLGKRWWKERLKASQDRNYVRKIVMSEMRTLAIIYSNIKKQCSTHGCGNYDGGHVGEMFHAQKFLSLCEAINTYTRDEESSTERAKMKMSLFFLLKKASKAIKASHVAEGRYNACIEIDSFMAILEQNSDFVFGGSGSKVTESGCSSQEDISDFFLEGDVGKLRNHILKGMTSMFLDTSLVWSADNFKKLRDMTVLRLSMLNVRRGGHPCRLTVQDFQDGKWIPLSDCQEQGSTAPLNDGELTGNWTTVYQTSLRSDCLIPVSVPADCLQAMVILSSRDKRESAGVSASNPYMFADVEGLKHHVTGWGILNNICDEAGIHTEAKVRAAENYQWVCLLYAAMELPETDRVSVFKKMGYTFESSDVVVVPETEEMTEEPSLGGKGQKRKQPHKDPEGEPPQIKKKPPDQEAQELHSAKKKKNRPKRLCPFCMKTLAGSQLTRHIIHVHKDLDEVKHAIRQPNHERQQYFAQMKKLGLYKQNAQRVMAGSGSLVTLKRTTNQKHPAVICKFCKGTYSKLCFRKHQCRPTENKEKSEEDFFSQSFQMMQREDPHFTSSVLSTIMHSKIGKACIMDKDVLTVGRWIWSTKKGQIEGNTKGIRSEVVRVMEHLVVLKVQFEEEFLKCGKEIDGFRTVDMFCVSNFDVLKRSVLSVAAKTERHGEDNKTKQNLFVLIKKAAAVFVASLLIQDNYGKAKEVEQFLGILEERKSDIVSDSENQVDVNQQDRNGELEEHLMEKYLATTRTKSLERREQPIKEGDCISNLFRCYIKLPRTQVIVDGCTVTKDLNKASNSGESGTITEAECVPKRKRPKVMNEDYTTIEDSESEQEGSKQADDTGDFQDREGSQKKHKWSEHATNLIREHFKSYICTTGELNRGKLPGKKELKDFLQKNREVLRKVKSEERKVLLVRTKVFNERNSYRRNLLSSNEKVD